MIVANVLKCLKCIVNKTRNNNVNNMSINKLEFESDFSINSYNKSIFYKKVNLKFDLSEKVNFRIGRFSRLLTHKC